MKSNLTTLILSRMATFSKGQKRIAQYILEHYDEAAFMTALRLGDTVGVSESTVVRFAAELGFEGYPEMQKAVQEMIRSKLDTIRRIELTRDRMSDREVADNVLAYDMSNIRQTLDELPRDTFYEAVDAIIHARKVYIFGAGSCRSLANFAAYYLKMLLGEIHLVYTSSQCEIFEEMFAINEQDVLIGLSFPRYSSKTAKTVHFAHSRKAKIVTITDSVLSPIAGYADYLLLAHSDMASIVDSLVAPLSIINALIVAVSVKTLDQNREKLTELENLWDTYRVYEKDGENEDEETGLL
ncbi:MAG: MurR/RpiR family transcriptional regulator [Clostridia bacterium]|nr:MurR/RpiR family transcriptional regulator [Clostridia bacterium]